jgi:hypothetical protein
MGDIVAQAEVYAHARAPSAGYNPLFLNRLGHYRRKFQKKRFAANAEYDFHAPNSTFILYHLA